LRRAPPIAALAAALLLAPAAASAQELRYRFEPGETARYRFSLHDRAGGRTRGLGGGFRVTALTPPDVDEQPVLLVEGPWPLVARIGVFG